MKTVPMIIENRQMSHPPTKTALQPSSTQGRSESRCFSYPGRGLPLRNNDGADIAVFAVFDPLVILRRIGGSAGVIHKSARLHFIFAGS